MILDSDHVVTLSCNTKTRPAAPVITVAPDKDWTGSPDEECGRAIPLTRE